MCMIFELKSLVEFCASLPSHLEAHLEGLICRVGRRLI